MNLLREALAAGGLDGNGSDGGNAPAEALTWDQRPTLTAAYLEEVEYDPSDYTDSDIPDYAPETAAQSNTWPVGETVALPAGTLVRGAYRQIINEAGDVELLNDVPGKTTIYAVLDADGKVIASGSLKPTGALRWIKCPAAVNVRDLGGWACDGGTVKYGLLIRGGEPGANDVDVLIHQCGVRHELQLRGGNEAPRTYSLLGVGITIPQQYVWYSLSDREDAWRTNLGCVFERAVSGIPVYCHCSAGADRTGTFVCLVEALLGVGQSSIDKDYELSCFYSGTGSDQTARRRNESGEWGKLITELMAVTLPSGAADNIRNHAVQFCLNLGFSAAQINAFRAAMIDGTPAAAAYAVSRSGSHVSWSNEAAGIIAGAAYSCTVTAADNYSLDSVTVTMGGVDVTATAFNSATGAVSIAAVTGDITITAETTVHKITNVWQIGQLNARLNTTETNPAADGSVISGWIAITAEMLAGSSIVFRSNMDLFNYAKRTSSGDYVRFYPSQTPGAQVASASLNSNNSWRSYDAESGVYTMTIPSSLWAGHENEIAYFRFNAFVSTSALTESFFDGAVLTVNEAI